MGDRSGIEWTDATWNPTTGCSRVSPGCDNCYAITMANRIQATGNAAYIATVKRRPLGHALNHPLQRLDWTGIIHTLPERLDIPIRWQRPRKIFVDSMSDLFHPSVPFEFVDRVWAVMAIASRHTFQILTKRPKRMAEYLRSRTTEIAVTADHPIQIEIDRIVDGRPKLKGAGLYFWPLRNVWLGTSAEDQASLDGRIPYLLRCPAAVRFISCEPLIGPLTLTANCWGDRLLRSIDWVIVGGESGPRARPMYEEWALELRHECVGERVAFFFKQGSKANWPDFKNFDSFPYVLRVREFPRTKP